MCPPKELLFCFLLLLFFYSANSGESSVITDSNDTLPNGLTTDESILFAMINDIRIQNELPSIPLSMDLCIVAQTHIADLIKWNPQDKGCSLHSWSGSGKWTSCCNTKDLSGIQCMKSKPREITGYKGDGYELIYWGEENATPAEAADMWKQVEASQDMILSRAKWSNYKWKGMGIAIKSGYAILWLGDADNSIAIVNIAEKPPVEQKGVLKPADVTKTAASVGKSMKPESLVSKTADVSKKEIIGMSDGIAGIQNYLIVGSYKEFKSADFELKEIRTKGYPVAFIFYQEPLYRITIGYFEESSKAYIMKNELKDTFPGIWILKK